MNCFCYEDTNNFVFCVEEYLPENEGVIISAWFQKEGNRYTKKYPVNLEDKALISANFSRLGESMFSNTGDWECALNVFANLCAQNNITWYITGSISEAILGVNVLPHDIDIITTCDDFYKIKDIFSEYVVEPFVDNKGEWVVRYFGRLCIAGVMVDVAADISREEQNHNYIAVSWNSFALKIEPIEERYNIEVQRNRTERILAIEAYLKINNLVMKDYVYTKKL